jgi:hypothetical protein
MKHYIVWYIDPLLGHSLPRIFLSFAAISNIRGVFGLQGFNVAICYSRARERLS